MAATNGRGHALMPNPYARIELRSPMPAGEQEACVEAFKSDVAGPLGLTYEGETRDEYHRAFTVFRFAWWRSWLHGLAVRAKEETRDLSDPGIVHARVESRTPDLPESVGRRG